MSNKKYVLLDDQAIAIGGTNLTILSILESRIDDITFIATKDLSKSAIESHKNKVWILGNIMSLFSREDDILHEVLESVDIVKIEFDYNFCLYRGEIPHKVLGKQECSCPFGLTGHPRISDAYNLLIKNTKHFFFMSERQRAIYSLHMPRLDFSKTSILSSCFSTESLELMASLSQKPKNNKYAILKGFSGWHSQAKGVEEAINFCETNSIPYEILPIQQHNEHLKTLSNYKGIVFLPIIDDTCPRCIIEARIMGLEVITNLRSQHTTEWWWKQAQETLAYIKSRPSFFWQIMDNIQ